MEIFDHLFPPLIDEAGNVNHDATPYWSPIPWGDIAEFVAMTNPPQEGTAGHYDMMASGYSLCCSVGDEYDAVWHVASTSETPCLGFLGTLCGLQGQAYPSDVVENGGQLNTVPGQHLGRALVFGKRTSDNPPRYTNMQVWARTFSQTDWSRPEWVPATPATLPRWDYISPNPIPRPIFARQPAPTGVPRAPKLYTVPSVNVETSGGGIRRTKTPHALVPPGKGTKEHKTRATPAADSLLGMALGAITEGADIVGAVYEALPANLRAKLRAENNGRKLTPQAQLEAIYTHGNDLNLGSVVLNLIGMVLEDYIIGKVNSKIASKHSSWLGNRPVGFQTGNQGRSTPGVRF